MSPDAATATLLHGAWAALRAGQAARARAQCEAALQQAPGNFDAWRMLALARQGLGDEPGAGEALARAMALRPGDPGTAFELGSWRLRQGEAAAAREPLRHAMHGLPNEARAAFRYGTACFLDNDFAAAAEGFRNATQRDPQWPVAWNNLSAALGRLHDYSAGILAAERYVALRPDEADSHQALAALLSNGSDSASLRRGLAEAERALQIDPGHAKAHCSAAVLLRKLGELATAESHALQAFRLAPQDAEIVEVLGELLLSNGRLAKAEALYAGARQAQVASAVLARQHGIALLQLGRPAARDVLAEAVREQPADQRAIAHLGVALAAAGDIEAAVELIGLRRHVHAIRLPVPAGFADTAHFHAALADDIRRHSQQRWEPAGLAARNAYLSGDLLADGTPAIRGFEQLLREAIEGFLAACRTQRAENPRDVFLAGAPREYRLHVWATQAAQGGYIDTHIHEESWLSGAYYVELPPAVRDDDATQAGWIEFGRPPPYLPAWPEQAVRRVRPQPGTLLLFPSCLFHRTLPYTGSGERISISFDLAAA